MVVVDASVWIALFREQDKFGEQAKKIFRKISSDQERISIPAIAFTEVAGVLRRITKDKNTARDAVLFMKEMELEVFANFVELEPVATKIAIHHSIRGADAYYLAVAEMTRANFFTFDKLQAEAFAEMSKAWQ